MEQNILFIYFLNIRIHLNIRIFIYLSSIVYVKNKFKNTLLHILNFKVILKDQMLRTEPILQSIYPSRSSLLK